VSDAAEIEAAEARGRRRGRDRRGQGRGPPGPSGARRGGRITAGDDEDDEESVTPWPPRPASARLPGPAGRPLPRRCTRSRAPRGAHRAAETRQKRNLRRFLREVVAELRKVIWPGRRELITYTTVVIVFVAFIVALVAGLDLLFAQGVLAVFG
jgi:preprotein translocase subunit SecE